MRKMNFIIACGTLAAIGTWQLASIAQQPRGPKPRLDAIELDDSDLTIEQQIQILTEQAVALSEEAASLSRNVADHDEEAEYKERPDNTRLDPNVQELQAKTQALAQLVKQMHEARAQEAKARGKSDEARHWADLAKSKAKAEAKEKTRRAPRVDYRAPIRTEAVLAEVQDEMRLHPGAHVMRNMMIQDQNGKRIVVKGDFPVQAAFSPEDAKRLEEFRHLIAEYRQEKDGERKEELKANIREKLESQLDRDIEARKTQLSQMEERVEKLRNQLEASENSKPATVDSLIQMLDGDNAPFGISPAWIDALSSAGPYRHSINIANPEAPVANHVMVAPLALDVGVVMPQPSLPQLSIGIADPTLPVPTLPAIPEAPAGVAPPAEPKPPVAIERPEVPEQPEQPELPEPPEAPEAPEIGR